MVPAFTLEAFYHLHKTGVASFILLTCCLVDQAGQMAAQLGHSHVYLVEVYIPREQSTTTRSRAVRSEVKMKTHPPLVHTPLTPLWVL